MALHSEFAGFYYLPVWPGLKSRRRRHIWVAEFFVGPSFAAKNFPAGIPVFPSPLKPTLPDINSNRNGRC